MSKKEVMKFGDVLNLMAVSMSDLKAKRIFWNDDTYIEINKQNNEVVMCNENNVIKWISCCSDILKDDWVIIYDKNKNG